MRRSLGLCVSSIVVLAAAATAAAALTNSVSASQTIATATLAAPTGLAVNQISCKKNSPPQIALSWTPSTSSFTSGYTIYRTTTSGTGYTQIGTTNSSTSSFTDPSTTLGYTTTYYYVVDATYQSWSARSAQSSVTTLSKQCA